MTKIAICQRKLRQLPFKTRNSPQPEPQTQLNWPKGPNHQHVVASNTMSGTPAQPSSQWTNWESNEQTALIPSSERENWKPKNFRWIQIATMFNVFLMGFDQTIAASTYAVIGSEFQSMNQVSWISTSYLITSTAFQPLYG